MDSYTTRVHSLPHTPPHSVTASTPREASSEGEALQASRGPGAGALRRRVVLNITLDFKFAVRIILKQFCMIVDLYLN